MPRNHKPKITSKCVANSYTGPNETIAEFSSPCGGGLISLRVTPDDTLIVDIYNYDPTVKVLVGKSKE